MLHVQLLVINASIMQPATSKSFGISINFQKYLLTKVVTKSLQNMKENYIKLSKQKAGRDEKHVYVFTWLIFCFKIFLNICVLVLDVSCQ